MDTAHLPESNREQSRMGVCRFVETILAG